MRVAAKWIAELLLLEFPRDKLILAEAIQSFGLEAQNQNNRDRLFKPNCSKLSDYFLL